MEIDKDGESFFLLLIMLITSIINDHVYLIVTFRLMQFDFNVGQFRVRPFTKLSDIYFQNKKLRSCNQWKVEVCSLVQQWVKSKDSKRLKDRT